ncbi:sporulation protein [Thermus sp. LT1-2-5]|uniref:SPOR domain-containing protein n=1 Tax=Thermus sp. LT1-2-5 TaxID=3026935 RepID=UPI0030E84E23
MRWLRENWLDLFIFLLIALVAAGIVLYLTGINPFSRPASQGVVPSPAPSPSAAPAPTPAPSPTPPPTPVEPVVTVIPLPKAPEAPAGEQRPLEAKPGQAVQGGGERGASAAPPPAPTGAYRVGVGAFANPENALRLERELKAKGYPARLEAAGNLTRVVVGPYATEEEAAQVARALASYGAQVYRGQGGAPPAAGQVYLQVGAFQREENALALAGKLKELGLPVVLVKDGVYRVRVGPVAEGEKEAVRAKVEALGLEALEVR